MKPIVAALAALLLIPALSATAQEAIQTRAGETAVPEAAAPRPLANDDQRQANGDWARRVMAGQASVDERDEDRAPAGRCQRNPDRTPHGEVWVGVGTGGYSTAGAVVTAPIGDCGEATVAVSRTEGGQARRGRRR